MLLVIMKQSFTPPYCGTGFFNNFSWLRKFRHALKQATSAIMNLAIIGTCPDTAIDYHKVLVSKGSLHAAINASANVNTEESILILVIY